MKSVFVQEQKQYTKSELSGVFKSQGCSLSDEKLVGLIKRLKDNGGMKVLSSRSERDLSELTDEEFISTDDKIGADDSQRFVFTFVGILDVDGTIIKSVPKYIKDVKASDTKDKFSTVLNVIKKYRPVEEPVRVATEDESEKATENLLSLLIYLFEDYLENGVYTNSKQELEINGDGEILWDKTINETFAIISGNRPYYTELYTRKRRNDDYDYFKRLHEYVVTEISSQLKDAQILDILGFDELELTEDSRDDFGDDDYILYRIGNELSVQFNTRKQLLLKAMYSYIAMKKHLNDESSFTLFGTFSFNMVWEEVCRATLRNVLDKKISSIFPEFAKKYKGVIGDNDTIANVIENPIWYGPDGELKADNGKYRPDFLAIENLSDTEKCYIIYDAKYYNIRMDGNTLKGQPGLESVTKQFMYHAVLKEFMGCAGVDKCFNIFLAPSDEKESEYCGSVIYPFLTEPMKLAPVQMFRIPAETVFTKYLNGSEYDFMELLSKLPNEDIRSIEDSSLYAKMMKRKDELSKSNSSPKSIGVEDVEEQAAENDNIIYLPVYTAVSAGYGTDAFEEPIGFIPIEKSELHPPDAGKYFYLRVEGESMKNAGINDGDYVLIRRSGKPKDGDIVAARLDNDKGVLKTMHKVKDGILFEPANPDFEPYTVRGEEFENNSAGYYGVVQKQHTLTDPEILSEDEIDTDKVL